MQLTIEYSYNDKYTDAYNASITVNGRTFARAGKNYQEAEDKVIRLVQTTLRAESKMPPKPKTIEVDVS